MGFGETKYGLNAEEQIRQDRLSSSAPNDDEQSDAGNSSGYPSSGSENKERPAEQSSAPAPQPEITREWVTRELARNAQIASARLPLKVDLKLTPRDPKHGPAIVREIEIYSQDLAASNQSLTQLGKSLAMFKGESEPKVEREIWAPMTEEKYRRMGRLFLRRADLKAEAERNKKAGENDQ